MSKIDFKKVARPGMVHDIKDGHKQSKPKKADYVRTINREWILTASRISPLAVAIAVELAYHAGKAKSTEVQITSEFYRQLNVQSRTVKKCLDQMVEQGILKIISYTYRAPKVILVKAFPLSKFK